MIIGTYALIVVLLAALSGWVAMKVTGKKLYTAVVPLIVLAFGYLLWTGVLENIAARRWGGTMTVTLPENTQLMGMTWKEDSLWVMYYDPASQKCIFAEDSRLGLLQGDVQVKNCKPLGLKP